MCRIQRTNSQQRGNLIKPQFQQAQNLLRRQVRVCLALLCICSQLLGQAHGASLGSIDFGELDPELEAQGWRLLTEDGVLPTRFALSDDGVLSIDATKANALMFRDVAAAEQSARYLTWRWRVEQSPIPSDLRRSKADDRPLAVYVGYQVASANLSLWTRITRSIVSRFTGLPQGQVMTYVWGGLDEVGAVYRNPYIRRIGRMQILRNGNSELHRWYCESVNLSEDFDRAFGYAPEQPLYLAISADAEDSDQPSVAQMSLPEFSAQPGCRTD